MRARIAIALLLYACSRVALAQTPTPTAPTTAPPSTPTPTPVDDATRIAKEAFLEGSAHFNLGKWSLAIEAWERGYRAKQDPVFLYNIAQAHRLNDAAERALFFYRNFLRVEPNAPNRAFVEQRIAQLEKVLAEQRDARAQAASERPPVLPPTTETPPKPTVAKTPSSRRTDLELAIGIAAWLAGLDGSATPSGTVGARAGYALVDRDRVRFSLGGALHYSWLSDVNSTDHLLSVLVEPMLRVRLFRQRLYLRAQLGLGAQLAVGVTRGSVLLVAGHDGGTYALFETRPTLGLEVAPLPWLRVGLTVGASISPAPQADLARAAWIRLLAGITLSFFL